MHFDRLRVKCILVTLLLTCLDVPHTEWIHSVYTNDTKTQNRCMALVVLSILRTNRATTNNTEGEGVIETNRMDTVLKDSYSPTSDYKFNTSIMFFSQSRVHVPSQNERKHQACIRKTNRASKTSIFVRQTKWPFGRKTKGDRKKDSRPPLLFALALVWHSSAQVLYFKVTNYSETQ